MILEGLKQKLEVAKSYYYSCVDKCRKADAECGKAEQKMNSIIQMIKMLEGKE